VRYRYETCEWATGVRRVSNIPAWDVWVRYRCERCEIPAWEVWVRYQCEVCEWDTSVRRVSEIPACEVCEWDTGVSRMSEIPAWDVWVRYRRETCEWDTGVSRVSEIPVWDVWVIYQCERCEWDTGVKRVSEILVWDAWVKWTIWSYQTHSTSDGDLSYNSAGPGHVSFPSHFRKWPQYSHRIAATAQYVRYRCETCEWSGFILLCGAQC